MGSFEDFQNVMGEINTGTRSVMGVIPGVDLFQGFAGKLVGTAGNMVDMFGNPVFLMAGGAVVLLILLK